MTDDREYAVQVDLHGYNDPETVRQAEEEQTRRAAAEKTRRAAAEQEAERAAEQARQEAEWGRRRAILRGDVLVSHNGREQRVSMAGWRDWTPDHRAEIAGLAREGTVHDAVTGEDLTGDAVLRSRLLAQESPPAEPALWWEKYQDDPALVDAPVRWLVRGVWVWGQIPMLGGPPKVGKSRLGVNVLGALAFGRSLLGRFEVPEAVTGRIVYVNVEVKSEEFEAEMLRLASWADWAGTEVEVEHLRGNGGALSFDLTNPEVYRQWLVRLAWCETCTGTDDVVPDVVIADGPSPIMNALGLGWDYVARWIAAFMRLMAELGVPNALVITQNTLTGDHPMGGVEVQADADGIWRYARTGRGRRLFSVPSPRLGHAEQVDPMEVTVAADGWLIAGSGRRGRAADGAIEQAPSPVPDTEEAAPMAPAAPTPPSAPSHRDAVLTFVRQCNAAGRGPSLRDIRANVVGRNPDLDRAVAELRDARLLVPRPSGRRGGGQAFWVTTPVPVEAETP